MRWRRLHRGRHRWSPTPVPGELYGWRLQVAYWGCFLVMMGWSVFCQLVFG